MRAALAVDPIELCAPGQALAPGTPPAAALARPLHRLRGEPLTALVAPPLQHRATRACAHARTEPMRSGALALLRLIGALHGRGEYRGALTRQSERPPSPPPRLFPR